MLNIKHPEADRLARTLAQLLNESITDALIEALQEKLLRVQGKHSPLELKEDLLKIGKRCAALPSKDKRSANKIIGYDSSGLPK